MVGIVVFKGKRVLVNSRGEIPKGNPKSIGEFSYKKELGSLCMNKKYVRYSLFQAPIAMVPNTGRYLWKKPTNLTKNSERNLISRYLNRTKIILVSGTPGAGKTEFSRKLSLFIRGKHLNVGKLLKKWGFTTYNKENKEYLVGVNAFRNAILRQIKANSNEKYLIIDSHMSHYLSPKYADICVILTCKRLKTLKERLSRRRYSQSKIRDNLDSEIFQMCKVDSLEEGHQIFSIDSSEKYSIKKFTNMYPAMFY